MLPAFNPCWNQIPSGQLLATGNAAMRMHWIRDSVPMADIRLILNVDPAMMNALDKLVVEAELDSRCQAVTSILRDWLIATGYLDDDKPMTLPTEVEDDSA
jgi:hypothetical protein